MSRRSRAVHRETPGDPRFGSQTVTKFINSLMLDGKKSIAEKIFYDAVDLMEQRSGQPGEETFELALNNAKPALEVKSRRVGGATYQVPIEVPVSRGNALAMRWVRDFARKKKGRPMKQKLADELLSAYKGEGAAVKKRDDTHKMAESNKAFSHLRW